jgi:hypothetical protein
MFAENQDLFTEVFTWLKKITKIFSSNMDGSVIFGLPLTTLDD